MSRICPLFPLLVLPAFLGCPRPPELKLVLTTLPLHAAIVKQLAGEWLPTRSLYQPGENPFKPPADLSAFFGNLSNVALYIAIGGPSDAALVGYFTGYRPAASVVLPFDTKGFYADDYFVWTDPAEARDMVDIILEALIKLAPQQAEVMTQRAAVLKKQYNAEFLRQVVQVRSGLKKTFFSISPSTYYVPARLHLQAVPFFATPVPGMRMTHEQFEKALDSLKAAGHPPVIAYTRYDDPDDVRRLADAAHAGTLELLLFPADLKPGAGLLEMFQENVRRIVEADR